MDKQTEPLFKTDVKLKVKNKFVKCHKVHPVSTDTEALLC